MYFIHSTNIYSVLGARCPFSNGDLKMKKQESYILMVGAVNIINKSTNKLIATKSNKFYEGNKYGLRSR